MAEKKDVKVEIDNGDVFYADEVGIMHNPLKFIIDFRNITPRIDMRNQDFQPLVLKHDVVMMDVFMAKNFVKMLQKNIKQYEKRFGKVEVPKAIKILEEDHSKMKNEKPHNDTPAYFG